jgi:hypothetical protein
MLVRFKMTENKFPEQNCASIRPDDEGNFTGRGEQIIRSDFADVSLLCCEPKGYNPL